MKNIKSYIVIFALLLVVVMTAFSAFAARDLSKYENMDAKPGIVKVYINDKLIDFSQDPVIIDGSTLVPLRKIFEELGATVNWEDSTKTAVAQKGSTSIKIAIGSKDFYKNGVVVQKLDVPAQLINGSTLVPVRAISEAFDCEVNWVGKTKTVVIYGNSKANNLPDYKTALGKTIYFRAETDKDFVKEYAVGDTMTFKLSVKCGGKMLYVPYIKWTSDGDDGAHYEGYATQDENGYFVFQTTLSKPGFVRVKAVACDEQKRQISAIEVFEGGAGADTSSLKIGTPEPSDYLTYWDNLKKAVYATEPKILDMQEVSGYSGYVVRDYQIQTAFDTFASVRVAYPQGAQKGSLITRFQFMPYGVNSCSLTPQPGYFDVVINAHAVPNGKPSSFYEEFKMKNNLYGYGFNDTENLKPETSYFHKMFARDLQAVRYFKDNEFGNGKYVFQGMSQGGMQACIMAAHTDGLATQVNLTVPWFCDVGATKTLGRMSGWRPNDMPGIHYFDTAIAAKYIDKKCMVSIEAGLGDYICPPSGIMAMYNEMTCTKSIQFIQNRTHEYVPSEQVKSTQFKRV